MNARLSALVLLAVVLSACGASVRQVIPTDRPAATITPTPTTSPTPGLGTTPSATPPVVATGPTPTSIFGPTRTAVAVLSTPTRVVNPNAPRIEFFTSDAVAVAPGDTINLFWSTRNTSGAVIYRLDQTGSRNQLWNVAPDGNLSVTTRRRDRGQTTFVLSVGEGDLKAEQSLTVPLTCPDPWFFQPAPDSCPAAPPESATLIEEPFQRGRMLYIGTRDRVYALFNDGRIPAWISFENRYDPAVHPELDESYVPPPGFVQPLRRLGFVWRGNDTVRTRLGMGLSEEIAFEGFIQAVTDTDGKENLFISSADGTVLQLLPEGDAWQIITPP